MFFKSYTHSLIMKHFDLLLTMKHFTPTTAITKPGKITQNSKVISASRETLGSKNMQHIDTQKHEGSSQ